MHRTLEAEAPSREDYRPEPRVLEQLVAFFRGEYSL